MLIFGGIIIALFAAIFAVTQMEEKTLQLAKRLIILLKVRQTVLTTTQIKSLSDLQKNLKEKKKKQYTFIKHLAFIAKNYLLS